MRFAPKIVGEAYTLDDYNATVYLLTYDNWREDVFTLDYNLTEGDYAGYYLIDEKQLLFLRRENYVVSENINKNQKIKIMVTDPLMPEADYKLVLSYKTPSTVVDEDGYSSTVEATDSLDENLEEEEDILPDYEQVALDMNLIEEKTVYYSKVDDKYYTEVPLDTSSLSNQYRRTYQVVLPDEFVESTIISREVTMDVDIHPRAEIDPWNGKTNESEEIVVFPDRHAEYGYTWDTLVNLIEKVPQNGKKHVFRLIHEGHPVYLTKEVHILHDQNVELRGGTNYMAMLNGKYAKRAFYVEPGGILSLKNIHFKHWLYFQDVEDSILKTNGYGGVILVDYTDLRGDSQLWGYLKVNHCEFEDCYAYYGGAIYSYHARLDVRYSTFLNCNAWKNKTSTNATYGGAIFYDSLRGYDFV